MCKGKFKSSSLLRLVVAKAGAKMTMMSGITEALVGERMEKVVHLTNVLFRRQMLREHNNKAIMVSRERAGGAVTYDASSRPMPSRSQATMRRSA